MGEVDLVGTRFGIDAYDYMWRLTRSRWAWEALRRNRTFRQQAKQRSEDEISIIEVQNNIKLLKPRLDQTLAARWGLSFLPDPDKNGFEADVFWTRSTFPRQIAFQILPCLLDEVCEIFTRTIETCDCTHLTNTDGNEFVLIRGQDGIVQARLEGLSMLSFARIKMRPILEGLSHLNEALAVLERTRKSLYDPPHPSPEPIWSRKSLALRNAMIALDCREADLDIFETASVIYGERRARDAWDSPSDAMRQEIKRALKRGKCLSDGGYRNLLSDYS